MDPCLDLEHTYAYVCREANRRTLLNDDQSISDSVAMLECQPNLPTHHTRFAATTSSIPTSRSFDIVNKHHGSSGPPRSCTHYGGTGHTKSHCHDLIGYPMNDYATLHTSSDFPSKSFKTSSTPIGSCIWNVDFGSTNHMLFDASISTLKSSETHFVSTANGTPITVIGVCSLSK
ncbi:hypothetical protein DKX38_015411 [Salix brachista]|uniref:Uncharacterized protein n=1 Tax=Salix brachista TaxID=2182728 RepID=A0A5N5L5T5_9ROSI|nr:hypothetical protein DKX38_015411 [Salix brachista]